MSFLQKLKKKGAVEVSNEEKQKTEAVKIVDEISHLEVDICQTDTEIVIYSPVFGVHGDDLEVFIEGDNDVVVIKGKRIRPDDLGQTANAGKFFLEECKWGEFFRQIILPEEISPSGSEAKIRNGVLVLKFPLRHASEKKVKMKILNLDERR